MADLDNDGHRDLISGSWPGELYWFRGRAGGGFEPGQMIRDREGEIINVGGGVEMRDDMILITGHCEWKTDPETNEHYLLYRGKEYRSVDGRQLASTGCATHAHAADWDGDGDLDLLVGDIRGQVFLLRNAGTPERPAFAGKELLQAGGRDLVVGRDAGPCTVDWDGDGDLDLLCGEDNGSVLLFENTGSATRPRLSDSRELIPPGKSFYGNDAPTHPVRGTRSKVCAADWNGDGLLDLLVGDVGYQMPEPDTLTEAEQAQRTEDEKRMAELQQQRGELMQKLMGPERVTDGEELERIQVKMQALSREFGEVYRRIPHPEPHGYVWLFLRKP